VWLSQTTLSVDETMETVSRLREKFPLLQDPPSDDICYATQNRQMAVKQMAPDTDLMIVVGSRNSSNSVRWSSCSGARAGAGHLVDFAEEIDPSWLEGVGTVGVTSGASVPEVLVRGVLAFLAEHGYEDVQPVAAPRRAVLFSLPHEFASRSEDQVRDRCQHVAPRRRLAALDLAAFRTSTELSHFVLSGVRFEALGSSSPPG